MLTKFIDLCQQGGAAEQQISTHQQIHKHKKVRESEGNGMMGGGGVSYVCLVKTNRCCHLGHQNILNMDLQHGTSACRETRSHSRISWTILSWRKPDDRKQDPGFACGTRTYIHHSRMHESRTKLRTNDTCAVSSGGRQTTATLAAKSWGGLNKYAGNRSATCESASPHLSPLRDRDRGGEGGGVDTT